MKYAVEQEMTSGFEPVWFEDDGITRRTYDSRDAAEDEIKDHITDCINAVEGGLMDDSPDPSEFRVVEVKA